MSREIIRTQKRVQGATPVAVVPTPGRPVRLYWSTDGTAKGVELDPETQWQCEASQADARQQAQGQDATRPVTLWQAEEAASDQPLVSPAWDDPEAVEWAA